ncbi:hypothetical protein BCR33DRAFT_247346 [Rhizoclosmatium globosum]|uniref:PI-PLC Y-box domain-containing protein n=1 Tax=Rhizoclosmatium globosum TaxID=329046 RepID=A0A1Y2CA62_9FUNG|nr:hypothetical protein BCR33DRAFT_247346 [Rhizoclosmatium globosum]|eukprot:ORY43744.1 hypothetical protein BCR33DRAFT_247346 [Rhizoclosmatium globosum]
MGEWLSGGYQKAIHCRKSLMDLVVYCKAVRFTGIEMLESMKYDEMVSITETKFLSLLSKPHPSSSTPRLPHFDPHSLDPPTFPPFYIPITCTHSTHS